MRKSFDCALAVFFWLVVIGWLAVPVIASAQNPHLITYQGDSGPGRGKHIVFLAGDHEYRSEETLPALARILARHYGFKCSVFFNVDPQTGFIDPGNSKIAGLEALKTADLLVIFLRFQDFPDDQMQHIVDYLDRGGPVIGLRTATHAFQIRRPDARFAKYTWDNKAPEYTGGFGRQILGETWVSHAGANHQTSSRLVLESSEANHPILRGVKDVWVESGVYTASPIEGSQILAMGQILDGMTPTSPVSAKKAQPVAWYRTYQSASGKTGRVFTTTHGASEDLLNDGFRRMLVNASLWAAGLESAIRPNGDISLVGPYHPSTFAFGGAVKGVKPSDIAGWNTPILKVPPPGPIPIAPADRRVNAAENVRLFVHEEGKGTALIALHGGPGFSSSYLAPDLAPLGASFRLFTYDQRGSGKSTVVSDAMQLKADQFVADLEAVRRATGAERVALLGHSWGAGLAALYAIAHPDRVSRILLVDPMPPRRVPYMEQFSTTLQARFSADDKTAMAAASAKRRDATDEALPGACREYYGVFIRGYLANPDSVKQMRGDVCDGPAEALRNHSKVNSTVMGDLGEFDWRTALGKLQMPVLIIHGDRDPIPLASAREWSASLPDARLLVIERSGHFPFVERPEVFFPAAVQFLNGRWPDGAIK